MKKNNMLRIASVLLVAVLLSTCAISGAFAKYTTSGTASDSARVAKFGITVTGAGEEVFKEEYNSDTVTYAAATVSTDVDVVAPGTTGTLAAFTFDGTAEVAVEVKTTAKVVLSGWDINGQADGGFYCPIIIKKNGTTVVNGLSCADAGAFYAAIATANENANATPIAAGDTVEIEDTWTWEWVYTDSADGSATDNDKKDTLLAEEAAYTSNTIQIDVTATVTQID